MNDAVEPSPPQPVWGNARSEDSAEAAQRDLFGFLEAFEAMAPPLAADATPPDVASGPEATEACERAARSAAEAIDEVTKENLRRLEATMSWLQDEARHLPRAAQLAPVQGVLPVRMCPDAPPVFDAIIDRSSLRRAVHGTVVRNTPPLPIWLREHEAPIRLPPPRRGRALWQRIVKFFWASAVAAPFAYVFAITTSPLHKHVVEIAGLVPTISLSLPVLQSRHGPQRGRELIAIASIAAPEDSAGIAAFGASGEAASPSGTAIAVPEAASAASTQAAAAPQAVVGPPDADRASAPEAAHARREQPVIARTEVGEMQPKSTVAAAGEADAKRAARQDVSELIEQGSQFFQIGDLLAARILFGRAAKAGDAAAAVAMGATYDPVVLAERGVRGVAGDLDKARAWYERAKDMGSSEGPRRLEMLANR